MKKINNKGLLSIQVNSNDEMSVIFKPVNGTVWMDRNEQWCLYYNSCSTVIEVYRYNGYAKEVMQNLLMEFAVEAQKLLQISLEGSVG
ncbi:hypothetical protein IR083_04155 [Dysgonomonas sp. GY75]|uniref:hypothetical protein n=1 Tax=Dysgonomonas sp. GY75 TaxID=2780419 RepID=UPI0018834545|nr:hypothetical protein [Dysgonomonas sp. GY75]MBF0648006.1 hypothetical protein [Dysgonomonas sp. GY75]